MEILETIPDKVYNKKPQRTFVGILTNAFKKITGKPEFKYYEKPKIKDRYFDLDEEIDDDEQDNNKRLKKALNLLEKAGLDYNLEEALEQLVEINFVIIFFFFIILNYLLNIYISFKILLLILIYCILIYFTFICSITIPNNNNIMT